jgi:hypothetical protein
VAVSLANPETSAALSLLNARAVRERAHRMLAIGLEDRLPNFCIHLDRMDGVVELVLETTRKAYPSFEVPFHSRWRHFVTNNDDRWADIADQAKWPDRAARARSEFDLAIVSVFLDAGAGQKPARPSAAPRDWDWPASPCSHPARFRPIRDSPCGSMPASWLVSPWPI